MASKLTLCLFLLNVSSPSSFQPRAPLKSSLFVLLLVTSQTTPSDEIHSDLCKTIVSSRTQPPRPLTHEFTPQLHFLPRLRPQPYSSSLSLTPAVLARPPRLNDVVRDRHNDLLCRAWPSNTSMLSLIEPFLDRVMCCYLGLKLSINFFPGRVVLAGLSLYLLVLVCRLYLLVISSASLFLTLLVD
jgi:hypothetical protein